MYTIEHRQKIPATVREVWDFMASPANLKEITPSYMAFDITTRNLSPKMYPGMIIAYKVSPLMNIKMRWVTEITHVDEPNFFVDEQRFGPYAFWHHQHHFREIPGGVLMTDIVNYLPPFGLLGSIANAAIIRKKLGDIFEFRNKKIIERFGEMPVAR